METAEIKIIKLRGEELASISIDPQILETKPRAGSKASPRPYQRATCLGRGFTVTPEFAKAFAAGEIAQVELKETSYEVDDVLNPNGAKLKRPSFAFAGSTTRANLISLIKFDQEVKAIKNPEIGKVVLDDAQMNKLQQLLLQ